MSWYARTGPRKRESGKFRSQAHVGIEKSAGEQYRGWSFSFIAHQTGSSVRRTLTSVSICDPSKNRAAYLRDFPSIQQAAAAAQEWIDHTLSMRLSKVVTSDVGAIPTLPEVLFTEPRP